MSLVCIPVTPGGGPGLSAGPAPPPLPTLPRVWDGQEWSRDGDGPSLDASMEWPEVELLGTNGLDNIRGPAGSFPRLGDLVAPLPADPAARLAATALAVALFMVA